MYLVEVVVIRRYCSRLEELSNKELLKIFKK